MIHTIYLDGKAYRVNNEHTYGTFNINIIIPGDILFHASPLGTNLFIVEKIDSVRKLVQVENGSVVNLYGGSYQLAKGSRRYFEFNFCSFPTEEELLKYITLNLGI